MGPAKNGERGNRYLEGKMTSAPEGVTNLRPLLHTLRELIQNARKQILRSADAVQVQTCWEIGRHIVEFEQGGAGRAEYGKRLLPTLAETLTAEFGRGFDVSNLRYMRLFYQAFPIRDALRHELSWTHYRTLLRVDNAQARQWYMDEAAAQGWSTRALERQIGTLYHERLLASSDRKAVEQEAASNIAPLQRTAGCVVAGGVGGCVAAMGNGILVLLGCPLWGGLASETEEHPNQIFPVELPLHGFCNGRRREGSVQGARSVRVHRSAAKTLDGFFPPQLDRSLKRGRSDEKNLVTLRYCRTHVRTKGPTCSM